MFHHHSLHHSSRKPLSLNDRITIINRVEKLQLLGVTIGLPIIFGCLILLTISLIGP